MIIVRSIVRNLMWEAIPAPDPEYTILYSKFEELEGFNYCICKTSDVNSIIAESKTPRTSSIAKEHHWFYIVELDVPETIGRESIEFRSQDLFFRDDRKSHIFEPVKWGQSAPENYKVIIANYDNNTLYDTDEEPIPIAIHDFMCEKYIYASKFRKAVESDKRIALSRSDYVPGNGAQFDWYIWLDKEQYKKFLLSKKYFRKFEVCLELLGYNYSEFERKDVTSDSDEEEDY